MGKNGGADWGILWESAGDINPHKTTYTLEYYKKFLGTRFKGKRILEIGCGTGINSVLMAAMGAKVSVMDYYKQALDLTRDLAEKAGVVSQMEFIYEDAFETKIENEFDVVHSEGVVEHFLLPRRQEIIDVHARAVKKNGHVVIIVPHAKCIPYMIGKRLAEMSNTWPFGKEYPYTARELVHRMEKSGLKHEKTLGGEFIVSFGWIFAPIWLPKYGKLLTRQMSSEMSKTMYKMNYANRFANRWGRAISVMGKKVTSV